MPGDGGGERQAYSRSTQQLLHKQMVEIHRLQQEQTELQVKIKISKSQARRLLDQAREKGLRSLMDRRQQLYKEVVQEQEHLKTLDQQIAKWESRVLMQLKDLRGPGLVLQKKAQNFHRVKVLENQLDRANTRFDTQLVKNRVLREELGLLHIQRNHFLHLDHQLRKELQDIRFSIQSHIDNSNAAFDAREEAKLKLSQLQEKLDKDLSQYNAELQVVQRQICHLEQLHNFLVTKNQERVVDDAVMMARRKREQEVAEGLRKTSLEKAILQYEEVLEKLGEITGHSQADDILKTYLENEERNFAVFTFINEQNSEMEKLAEEIQQIQDALAQLTLAQEEAEQGSKRQQLDALEQRKVDLAKEAEAVEARQDKMSKTLDQLKAATKSLFYKAKCDDTRLKELLGGSHMGTKIMELLLSLIEHRVMDLLAAQAFASSLESSSYNPQSTALRLLGQSEDAIPKKLVPPQPPSHMDDPVGLEQMDERPLTREEILAQVLKAMQDRELGKEHPATTLQLSKRASEKPSV
uniref:Coiled-coil domain-containing protein 114 n=1 Tax=Phascolarctos cinereus TaxID=38626 RepID=A0A6P5LSV4_PHACI|nr:coiled-coil domain-containing protein 114 [Phascolarctos cinereus]XP_020859111.1 coiled-coil domain-containing protein 114 [Phascolarctos cinereus]XP_020859112.1 coiled-coil domain-containing protein 114 [Phascolarctos cinereus]XP_020859113.1 coiled-coil domain-containing protein 114 [Phascolarctos cinereus]